MFRIQRRFCPHCNELVTLKTLRAHKRLYYDKVIWAQYSSYSYFVLSSTCTVCIVIFRASSYHFDLHHVNYATIEYYSMYTYMIPVCELYFTAPQIMEFC